LPCSTSLPQADLASQSPEARAAPRESATGAPQHEVIFGLPGPRYAREMHYLKVHAYRVRRKMGEEGGQFLPSDPSWATG
jgi:hypothetical protein